MKIVRCPWVGAMVLVACLFASIRSFAQSGPPPLPPIYLLQSFRFNTNFQGLHGYLPIAYTNIESEPVWRGDALLIGNTNTAPSFLQYHVVETNHHLNLDFVIGSISFAFAPNWASADATQNGAGPGERAYFLGAGDWTSNSPNGFFGLSADAYGTNLSFWGFSNGVATMYVNAQISWASNAFHYVDCEYSPSNSFLYLDGQLAASGAGVTIVPGTNVWTNGFFIGSDSQLVAPVRIGDGAYVGTGTTVTLDIPADALDIGRARQENKPGYGAKLRERLGARAEAAKAKKKAEPTGSK